jgi:peptidylamidoglycolate lyase
MEKELTESFSFDSHWPPLTSELTTRRRQISGLVFNRAGELLALSRGNNDWIPKQGFKQRRIGDDVVLVIDTNSGQVIRRWGANLFVMPHQIITDNHDNIWITDCGAHRLFKFSPAGELLLEVGGDETGLKLPTDLVPMDDGSIFVSDGYGNARVLHLDAQGRLIHQWGNKGTTAGQFNLPHAITADQSGRIYVADRENYRIQIFNQQGVLLDLWEHMEQVLTLRFCNDKLFALSNLAAEKGVVRQLSTHGHRVTEFFTKPAGIEGDFEWPHGMAISPNGNHIYIGYTATGKRLQRFARN